MTTFRPIQEAFTAGEISPLFYSQQSSDLYRMGLKQCQNMFPLTQGGVRSRPGLRYAASISTPLLGGNNARCFPIEISQESWAIAVMFNGELFLITDETLLADVQFVQNPEFEDGMTSWTSRTVGRATVSPRTVGGDSVIYMDASIIISGQDPVVGEAYLRQAPLVTHPGGEDLTLDVELHVPETSAPGALISFSIWGDAYDGDDLLYVNAAFPDPGDTVVLRTTIPDTAGYTGRIFIQVGFAGISFVDLSQCHVRHVYVRAPDVEVPPPDPIPIPYADTELPEIQYAQNPFNDAVFFVHKAHPPQELQLDSGDWVFREIEFTTAGPGSFPPWDEINGYPSCIGAFQGRCVFAGSPGHPQTTWTSAPGDWYDVDEDPSPTAAEPVWWTLSERGALRWVHGQKELLHGTTVAEHSIDSVGGLLQAGSLNVNKQSSYGSKAIQAVDVGEVVIYVNSDGLKMRAMGLNDTVQGWKSSNLTWTAEHITYPGVARMALARDPFQAIWAPLSNGTLAGLTFEPTYNLMSWHKHDTDGEIMDCCNARVGDRDFTFFLVRRFNADGAHVYLEYFSDLAYMDSFTRTILGTPSDTIAGLEHLEGKAVQIVADGVVQPPGVVEGGAVVLDEPASEVEVGLPYTCMIETLPAPSPGQVGGLGAEKSWAEIGVRMVNSQAPIVNGIRQDEGTDDPMMVELGWDKYATIVVEQDLPVPLVVTGIYGRLSTEDIIG